MHKYGTKNVCTLVLTGKFVMVKIILGIQVMLRQTSRLFETLKVPCINYIIAARDFVVLIIYNVFSTFNVFMTYHHLYTAGRYTLKIFQIATKVNFTSTIFFMEYFKHNWPFSFFYNIYHNITASHGMLPIQQL